MKTSLASIVFSLLVGHVFGEICGAVSPSRRTDPQLRCNFQGYLTNPSTIGATQQFTPVGAQAIAQCRNLCLENQYCAAYSYDKTSGACNQYDHKPQEQGIRPGRTSVYFWNRDCWAQNFTSAAGFVNPGFETGSLRPWSPYSDNNAHEPAVVRPGSNGTVYSARLSVGTNIGTTEQSITQTFTICPNTTLFIQPVYRYLGPANGNFSILSVGISDASDNQGEACASATSSSRKAINASMWTTFFDPDYSWIAIYSEPIVSSYVFQFALQYDSVDDGYGFGTTPNPELAQWEVDLNIAQTYTPKTSSHGLSCGTTNSPVAGGNF